MYMDGITPCFDDAVDWITGSANNVVNHYRERRIVIFDVPLFYWTSAKNI